MWATRIDRRRTVRELGLAGSARRCLVIRRAAIVEMYALVALLAAAAATALARPPGMGFHPLPSEPIEDPIQVRARPVYEGSFGDYMLPRYIVPRFFALEEGPRQAPPPPPPPQPSSNHYDWLAREIDRLNLIDFEETPNNFERDPPDRRSPRTFFSFFESQPNFSSLDDYEEPDLQEAYPEDETNDDKKEFALTPKDEHFFDSVEIPDNSKLPSGEARREEVLSLPIPKPASGGPGVFEGPRKTRQNPIKSKTKTLVAENLDKLRNGLSHEEGGIGMDSPRHIHMLDNAGNSLETVFGVAIIAAMAAALTVAIVGLSYGLYTLSKKAKAAADVDYLAYGVTGPSIDTSGDRKLAHSAHMYHYHHQKNQLMAMERHGLEHNNGSVSDPESEEENEEGDYTVYECPGFATTGEMEVQNPLFSDDPTPGNLEVVKQQPPKN